MTQAIESSAPAIETYPCPACGTWVCDDCGAQRPYASRFSERPQQCARCHSVNGQMKAGRHRAGRADDHAAASQSCLADGLMLRYPLGIER